MHCGKELPSGNINYCPTCGNSLTSASRKDFENKTLIYDRKKLRLLYLLPILTGIIGGIVLYLMIKDDDKKMARNGIILGTCFSVIGFILLSVLIALIRR